MQLQTTYPNNNYPIIVEHNAFESYLNIYKTMIKCFLSLMNTSILTLKLSLCHFLNQHTYIR